MDRYEGPATIRISRQRPVTTITGSAADEGPKRARNEHGRRFCKLFHFQIDRFPSLINCVSVSQHETALLIIWINSDFHPPQLHTDCECAMTTVYEPWDVARGAEIIAEHHHLEGATLVILHALQETFGYVPEPTIPLIAEALNLSRAEVHGVFTFYHDFRHEPVGRRVLKLCRAEACQAAGGDAMAARAESKLGIRIGSTTPDRRVTLEPIYCLGLCATAPSAMLDGRVVGRLNEARIDALVAEARG
jgi:formate dehydrogenase subunit gamma